MRAWNRCSLFVLALALAACGDGLPAEPDDPDPPDASSSDEPDAGPPDAAPPDAAPPDAAPGECDGEADGTPCGDPTDTECDAADSCLAGVCVENVAADGDPCGDPTDTECDAADSCLAGVCADNLAADGDPCGDPTDTECDDPDSCAAGVCAENLAADGDPCGDPTDTDCDDPDACASGACATNNEADGAVCYDCAGGPGQCTTCTAAACDEASCTLGDPQTLVTPAPHGNNNAGYMFDVAATNTVTITSFDVYPQGKSTGVEIYTKAGTHVGFETDANAWTLVGSAGALAPDGANPVPLPIAVATTIEAGTTTAFYVTSTGGGNLNYHNGTSRATVAASDANITLYEGCGKSYPFGATNVTRVFEGNIHYTAPTPAEVLDSSTGTATGGDVDSVMFDLVATNAVQEADTLAVELAAGTFDVDVYFRRGTHVGSEGSADGWQLLASEAGVVSAGGGALSPISLASPVDIAAGDTAAFYVDTGDGEAGLQVDQGGAVGDPAAATADQTLLVGRALGGGFGPAGGAAIFRGSLDYGECAAD